MTMVTIPLPSPNLHRSNPSSFLPPSNVHPKSTLKQQQRHNPPISCKHKLVRCPPLDRHATTHNTLRFATKLQTLLLSKPKHFLPLRILYRCRRYLSIPHLPYSNLISMILRYPLLFHLSHTPSFTSPSLSLLSVSLTPSALSLSSLNTSLRNQISNSLADKLHKLLMLSPHRRLLLSKLVHIAPDLGLPINFRSTLCNAHPNRFRIVQTSYGPALELVQWDSSLATPLPPVTINKHSHSPIIDRPPKFKQLKLRRGLNLKRKHREYLIRLQELPEVSPYDDVGVGMTVEEMEKRACGVVREVVGMTVERRTLVDHLTHFRKDFGLPNKLRGMMVRHPEMFYVSVKGERDSVFLVEAYDDKGKLVVEDELLAAKERLLELVREGKRMRRASKRGAVCESDDDDEDDNMDDEEEEDDDGFGDLFAAGIEDDWEDFGDDSNQEVMGVEEFWSMKAGGGEGGSKLESW